MTEEQIASKLSNIVKTRQNWDCEFRSLEVHREARFVELWYRDSGVGEDYVLDALQAEWPDRALDMDVDGGCDTCGYGRRISITISGAEPWL